MLVTQTEAAAILRVSVRTVARLRAAGELPYLPGRPVRIETADIDRYIQRCKRSSKRTGPASGKSATQSGSGTEHGALEPYQRGLMTGRMRSGS